MTARERIENYRSGTQQSGGLTARERIENYRQENGLSAEPAAAETVQTAAEPVQASSAAAKVQPLHSAINAAAPGSFGGRLESSAARLRQELQPTAQRRDRGQIQAELDSNAKKMQAVEDGIKAMEGTLRRTQGSYGRVRDAYTADRLSQQQTEQQATLDESRRQLDELTARRAQLERELQDAKYNEWLGLMQQPDFAEKSRYKSTENGRERKFSPVTGTYTGTGFDDIYYDYINGNQTAQDMTLLADTAQGTSHAGWRGLPENVVSLFNYIYATQGRDKAYAFLDEAAQRAYTGLEAAALSFASGTGALSLGAALGSIGGGESAKRTADVYKQLTRETQESAAQHPGLARAGSIAGNIALMYGIGAGAGTIAAKAGLPYIAGRTAAGALSFGGANAIQNAGAVSTGQLSVEDYLEGIGISGAAGGAGGAAGALVGSGLASVLEKHGLMTPFMEFIRQTAGGVTESTVNTATEYTLRGEAPTKEELAQTLITTFAFSIITSAANTLKTTAAQKANMEEAARALNEGYARLMNEANGMTPEGVAQQAQRILEQIDSTRNALKGTYIAGQQNAVNKIYAGLDILEDVMKGYLNGSTAAPVSSVTGGSGSYGMTVRPAQSAAGDAQGAFDMQAGTNIAAAANAAQRPTESVQAGTDIAAAAQASTGTARPAGQQNAAPGAGAADAGGIQANNSANAGAGNLLRENAAQEGYSGGTSDSLRSFIENTRSMDEQERARQHTDLDTQTTRAQETAEQLTGVATDGSRIGGSAVTYIDSRYGANGTANHSMESIDDFSGMGYVLDNFTDVRLLNADELDAGAAKLIREFGGSVVRFSMPVDGGNYIVEAVPDSNTKKLSVVSAYMSSAAEGNVQQNGAAEASSALPVPAVNTIESTRDGENGWGTHYRGAVEALEAGMKELAPGLWREYSGEEYTPERDAIALALLRVSRDVDSGSVSPAKALRYLERAYKSGGMEAIERIGAADGTYAPRAGETVTLPTAEQELDGRNGGKLNGQKQAETDSTGRERTETDGGDQISDRDGGRDADKRSGGKAGVVERSGAGRVDAGRKAIERQNRGRRLPLERVSSHELGLKWGTENPSVRLLPAEAWDEGLRQTAERLERETGCGVTYVLGGMEIEDPDGETHTVRGVITPEQILIQADCMSATAEQIGDHELFHYYADNNPGLISSVREEITEKYGREEFDEIVGRYIERLRGIIDVSESPFAGAQDAVLEDIENEIFADAYAGINAFGAHAERYRGTTKRTLEERGIAKPGRENGAATDRRTGPPERYGIDEIVDTDGRSYGLGVHLDSTLLKNLTDSERIQMVKERVKELGGRHFTAYDSDGNEVDIQIAEPGARFVNRNGKNVLVNKDLTTKNRNLKVKQEAVVLADELITTARHKSDHAARYPHGWLDGDGKNDWAKWTTYIQDKENAVWKATLHIATTADGEKILYDIDPIKKTGQRGKSRTSTVEDNIAPKKLPVKRKFSLDEPVERTKDLIAVHNKDWAVIRDAALKWGGIPSPSVAIADAQEGHVKYGDTSVVYPRATIDPQADSRNRVYGSDAWTPTSSSARVEREVSYEAKRRIESGIERLSRQTANGIFSSGSVLGSAGIEDVTDLDAKEIARKLAAQDAVKAAYLASRGEDIDIAYKAKEFDGIYGNAALKKYIDRVGPQELAELYVKLETGERLTRGELKPAEDVIRQAFEEKHARILARRPELREKRIADYMESNAAPNRVEDFIRHAQEYYADGGAVTDEIDRMETRGRLNAAADTAEVEAWAERQLDGLLGEPGIYNGEDYYEPNGNRRNFGDTHWEYSAENIVRAMNNAGARAEGMWGVTGTTLAATATPEYGSVEEMHADEGRLQRLEQGRYDRLMEDLGTELDRVTDDLMRTTKHHADNTYEEQEILGGIITQAAQGERTVPAIKRAFRTEGYTISDGHAASIIRLLDHAASVPTEYFEAKPQRVVPFEEAVAIVAPDSAPAEEVAAVKAATGANIIQYETGNDAQRKKIVNSLPGVRFSVSETEDNEPFVEVERDILAGVPEADWVSAVKENLKKKFPSGITVGNNEINIDKQSHREMTFSRYMQWLYNRDPQLRADKLRATDNADEILHAATGWVNEGLKYPRKDDIRDFARGNVLLRVGGSDYAADVVVGTRKSGSMLMYDILNLQPTSFTKKRTDAAITANPSPGAGRSTASVSGERVAQSGASVKRKFSSDEPDAGGQVPAENGEEKPEKKKRRVTKPVAESRPIIAKQDLRQSMLGLFSIPTGMKAEVGQHIDRMADRLFAEGGSVQRARWTGARKTGHVKTAQSIDR